MRRRDLIAGILVSTAAPSWAQQSRSYRIATVSVAAAVTEMSETGAAHYRAFLGELRRLGYVEGQNLIVERFSAEGHPERFREIADEVVRRRPDAVLVIGTGILREFKARTATIPIVGWSSDPVTLGIVGSLARPDSNITGVSVDGGLEIWAKTLGLLKETLPKLSRVGLLVMPTPEGQRVAAILREAANKVDISIVDSPLNEPIDEPAYRRALADMVHQGAEAVYVAATGEFFANRRLIVELVEKQGLPAIYPLREYVEIGGLMAYAADVPDVFVHAADEVADILKGKKPRDIPYYQARKFNLIINLKTAKTLSIEIPNSLLAQADEVIE